MPTEPNYTKESLELLGRLDERTKAIQTDIINIRSEIKDQKEAIETLRDGQDDKYVRRESFLPIQKIVYGVVGLIMTAVIVALLGLVMIK